MSILNLFGRKEEKPYVCAIVLAAGSSTRMMGMDKILTEINGLPVVAYSLLAMQMCSYVDEIIVACSRDSLIDVSDVCKNLAIDKATKVINGGATRQESVLRAALECSAKTKFALVHDGARPVISPEMIERVCKKAFEYNGHCATLAVPVVDTIKIVRDGLGQETLPRAELFAIQTPQVTDIALLKGALTFARDNKILVTDDCAAVELLGVKPAIVEGSYQNIKITTQSDLEVAAVFLERMDSEG